MEFIAIGDPHFDSPLGKHVPDVNSVIGREILKVLAYADRKHVKNIVILGDLAHKTRLSYEGYMALREVLAHREFDFHIIPGNHDLRSADPMAGHSLELLLQDKRLGLFPNVDIYLQPTNVKIDRVGVRFLPWPHNTYSKKRLNFSHLEVYGSKAESGYKMVNKDLSKSKAVNVSGHLHTYHKVRNTHYAGTLIYNDFGTTGPRFFLHGEYTSPEDYDIRPVKHKPEYVLESHIVANRKDIAALPTSPTTLIRLVIEDGSDLHPSMWADRPNVVEHKPFKSREDLQEIISHNLVDGKDLQVDSEAFITAFLDQKEMETELRKRVARTRHRLFGGT